MDDPGISAAEVMGSLPSIDELVDMAVCSPGGVSMHSLWPSADNICARACQIKVMLYTDKVGLPTTSRLLYGLVLTCAMHCVACSLECGAPLREAGPQRGDVPASDWTGK